MTASFVWVNFSVTRCSNFAPFGWFSETLGHFFLHNSLLLGASLTKFFFTGGDFFYELNHCWALFCWQLGSFSHWTKFLPTFLQVSWLPDNCKRFYESEKQKEINRFFNLTQSLNRGFLPTFPTLGWRFNSWPEDAIKSNQHCYVEGNVAFKVVAKNALKFSGLYDPLC